MHIKEEQTTQWPKDTKGVIRICISKKNRQHNGQKKKYKRTNNDLQNIHIKHYNYLWYMQGRLLLESLRDTLRIKIQ